MASGKSKSSSKKSNTSKYDASVTDALTPYNINMPTGMVSYEGKTMNFSPVRSNYDSSIENLQNQGIYDTLLNMPKKYDVETSYDNPYYKTFLNWNNRAIDSQREQDTKAFENQMAARNQIGSSYDAYYRSLMNKDYGDRYASAQDRARLASSDAYNTSIQQGLSTLGALRNDKSAALDQMYAPLKLAMGYQSTLGPLQSNLAGYYGGLAQQQMAGQNQLNAINAQKPSVMDKLLGYWQGNADTLVKAMGGF